MSRAAAHAAGTPQEHRTPLRRARDILAVSGAALQPFGYRAVDAEFVAAVALLGGYFLRRQYRSFARCRAGRAEVTLVRRLESNGHATPVVGKTMYRLRGAAVHKAIGSGLRGSPPRARRAVKQRLLALDYLIEHRDGGRWLLTAPAKGACFASLGVPSDRWPSPTRRRAGRLRPFADGFPIQHAGSNPPLFSFSYAHAGASQSAMNRHLRVYQALAASLADLGHDCEWVVLADAPAQFVRLRQAWRRWRDRLERDWIESEYFELRRAVEKRCWRALSLQAVERYAVLRSALHGDPTERRYAKWIERGAPAREHRTCLADSCSYREVLLDYDYTAADAIVRPA